MRSALFATLAISLHAGLAGAADFEGVIRSRMTAGAGEGREASGTGVMYVAPAGIRMEVQVKAGQRELQFASLVLHARPGVAYRLDDAKKTYSEDDASAPEPGAARRFRVEKLGSEKVAGLTCAHLALTDEGGARFELWTTSDLGGSERFWSSQARAEGRWGGMFQALHAAGVDGWPLKWTEGKRGAVWETTSVERRSVSPSLFDLSQYKKDEGPRLTPEQQKALQEYMKRRSEQREKPPAPGDGKAVGPAAAPCEEEKPCPVE